MTRILLIRHAHSVANAKGILAGKSPGVLLTDLGQKQSHDLAERLSGSKITRVRISPLERCHMTVAPLLDSINVKNRPEVIVDQNLSEVDISLSRETLERCSEPTKRYVFSKWRGLG
jgi:broad specificity phosphatase PhoE